MYDKVRVKKSQIFEVRQDTSQKETKTEERVGFATWAPPGTRGRRPPSNSGRVEFFGLLSIWAVSRGLWRLFLHGFGRLFKLKFRVNHIYFLRLFDRFLEATQLNFLLF